MQTDGRNRLESRAFTLNSAAVCSHILMKIPFILLLAITVGAVATPAWVEPTTTLLPPSVTYVSDALEIPLRAGASERYKGIGSVRGGSPITVLKIDIAKG